MWSILLRDTGEFVPWEYVMELSERFLRLLKMETYQPKNKGDNSIIMNDNVNTNISLWHKHSHLFIREMVRSGLLKTRHISN